VKQGNFFGEEPNWWDEHWQDMPAFEQGKKEPFACINIRFETQADLEVFSTLIDQQLTYKTKSIWFPFKSHWGADHNKKAWVDDDG
tara:strand:- start:1629 stop:1886 length:258 start_codon:yes stop_codon:yes gene_type:complete